MTNAKLIPIIQASLLFFVPFAFAFNEDSPSEDKLISTLEYIARGYETNVQNVGPLRIQGRIFCVQKAQEGREIPDEKILSQRWLNFDYTQKDGKQRYEHDQLLRPNERLYALDNNKRLLTFATNTVRIYPLSNEEFRWSRITELYNTFLRLGTAQGRENVGQAMHTLIEEVRDGKFSQENWNMSIDVNEKGLFNVYIKRKSIVEEYVIDSYKGFNLVKAKFLTPSKKYWREWEGLYEYTQIENGQWVFTKGQIDGLENGVVYERRLETNNFQTDFEAPDEIFELASLNIPVDIYMVDYSFSPPLVIKKDPSSNIDFLDALVEADIAKTEIADVNDKGIVNVNTHQAYVEHAVRNTKKSNKAPMATHEGKWNWFIVVLAFIGVIGGTVSVMIYRRLKGKVQR